MLEKDFYKLKREYAVYKTKVGFIRIEYTDAYVVRVKIVEDNDEIGEKTELTDKVYSQLVEYFNGERKVFDFAYELRGTEFQKKVWNALITIPYGETRSYKEVAALIGNEQASRAVGMANNKNPILFAVPCHRVIGADGRLVGYAGGLEVKQQLLGMEKQK